MELTFNRPYHSAFAYGYVMVFVCLVIMFVAAITGIVPLAMQPLFIFLIVGTMIGGCIVAQIGYFKSIDRQAYPIVIVLISVALMMVVVYALTHS